MHRYRHLMVGLTRTGTDVDLIRYAALIARLGTATEVRFVHVLPSASGTAPAPSHDEALADVQGRVRDHFTGVAADVRVACDVLKGPLLDRLLAYAAEQEVDLLFVGHRHGHPGRSSLARRLAMKAPCSVWMVPEGARAALDLILVPVDFSDHAADTLQVAASLTRLAGSAECRALHVYFNEATVTYEDYDQVLRGREQEAFDQFLAPVNTHGVPVTPVFEPGANVAHVIHRVAAEQGADLIVMGTRGRSRSASILLGSVTEETIIDTRLPLLVVKHYGARLGLLQVLLDRSFRQKKGPRFD